jgi:Rieske Fe-S protein
MKRRQWLASMGQGLGAGAVLMGTGLAGGCSGGGRDRPAGPVEIPLADLPVDGRLTVSYRGEPVELSRDGDTVIARSLWCTHVGCKVSWRADRRLYVCPCHEGTYNPDGSVHAGPPPAPLEEYPVRIRGDRIVIGEAVGS